MDWSSVYDEDGDESGDFNRVENTPVSVRASILDSLQVYNPYVCYAFTVNYILGVGCLGIPYAFYQSGIILGSALIIFLSFISYTTVMWIAETSHRGMQLRLDSYSKNPFRSPKLMRRKKHSAHRASIGKTGYSNKRAVKLAACDPSSETVSRGTSFVEGKEGEIFLVLNDRNGTDKQVPSASYLSVSQLTYDYGGEAQGRTPRINGTLEQGNSNILVESTSLFSGRGRSDTDEHDTENLEFSELEVAELTLDILGPKGFVVYQFALSVLTYVGLLAYTQVFIQSFKSEVWPSAPSIVPNLLFGMLVLPLSCCDLSEQITAQVMMSLMRFFSFAVLIAGTLAALYINKPVTGIVDMSSVQSSVVIGGRLRGHTPLADFSGFGVMFTTAIFR
jgi:Transmembrane amino acid transporter protein